MKHTEQFDIHVIDEQKMVSSAKGAWWATTILVAALIALGGIVMKMYADNVTLALEGMRDLTIRVRVLESKDANIR